MRYLLEMSGESLNLARAEALSVCGLPLEDSIADGRALALECDISADELVSRPALAWSVSQHLFSCAPESLGRLLSEVKLPGKSFRVKACRLDEKYKPGDGTELARLAGTTLAERYQVDLQKPDSELRILMADVYHVGILIGEIDRPSYEARKSENRPFNHPISLHPRLARALVNLTGIKKGQTLLDPMCGTGGIILEAGLMGCKALGGDIDSRMVEGASKNLAHFGVNDFEIIRRDISDWSGKVDAICTDPPYGRSASTAKEPIDSLYARLFSTSHGLLGKNGKLAISLPEQKHADLAEGFVLEGMFPVRVHRSLTRHFCVFRKK